ncbi:DMT family transporter [Shimia abyssi]|uniref:EamA-like transporter family protein n=1 Tax=Shimia abyssi TaxID=1662395 RepID=A0A2P8FED1_9RHOB|nr:DMT family transporter [Shimia abyssi]PSL20090.1 hypothetical protein CLV88_104150 [Shimia abyssi]
MGFLGVMFMLWEALEQPGQGALIGVAAGVAYACAMAFVRVHTKAMTKTETSCAIAFYFAIVATAVGLASWPFGWVPVGGTVLVALIGAGLIGGIAHIVSNEAVARAPVSALAPFDFTGMVWALGFDLMLFSILPGYLGLLGVFSITAAAMIVTFAKRPPLRAGTQS